MRITIAYLFIALGFVSCKNLEVSFEPEVPEAVEYNDLGRGELFGNGSEGIEQGHVLLKNEDDWLAMRMKMDRINMSSNKIETSLDYDTDNMFIYFDKVRSTGGYVLSVTEVGKTSDSLYVSVLIRKPDGPAATVLTQPFVAISYPKSDLPVSVITSEQ